MSESRLPKFIDTVIIGAGITGCSTALALAERGCTDLLIVDRSSISVPAGSTGHAPGLLGQISQSRDMTELAKRSAHLYRTTPAEHPAYSAVGSVEVARGEMAIRRFEDKVKRGTAAGLSARLLERVDLSALLPDMDTRGLAAGIFAPDDGVLDARRALVGIAERVRNAGIAIHEQTEVHRIVVERGKVTGVETSLGRINCSRVLVAVGIWGAIFLDSLDVKLPLFPVQHPYLYTEPLPSLAKTEVEASLPFVRDLDHLTYFRQHGQGYGYGWYNHPPLLAEMLRQPSSELPYRADVFDPTRRLELFPFLKDAPVRRRLNGIFSMTPDGLPLLGCLRSVEGLWVAEAVWVAHAGGVGQVMAELLLDGRTDIVDQALFDAGRFSGESLSSACRRSLSLYNDIYQWPMQ